MFLHLFFKEIKQYFNSASGAIAIFVFIVASWVFCWVLPNTSFLNYGYAEMGSFFNIAPYLLMFLIPALAMKVWTEEFETGTIELLVTKPISIFSYNLSKFLAALVIIKIAILSSLVFFYSLYKMASPVGNVDVSGVIGSYIGLLFLAVLFLAISIMASAIAKTQIIAFILALVLCFLFYEIFSQLATIQAIPNFIKNILEYIGLSTHYNSLGRGVLQLSDLSYFIGLTAIFLYLSQIFVQNKIAK